MEKAEKIRVLKAFDVCLPILKAYISGNFKQSDRHQILRFVYFVLGVTLYFVIFPILIVMLELWYIFDNDGAIKIIVVVIPPALTVIQSVVSFITLTAKNQVITETIDRIQNVIDESECSIFCSF